MVFILRYSLEIQDFWYPIHLIALGKNTTNLFYIYHVYIYHMDTDVGDGHNSHKNDQNLAPVPTDSSFLSLHQSFGFYNLNLAILVFPQITLTLCCGSWSYSLLFIVI